MVRKAKLIKKANIVVEKFKDGKKTFFKVNVPKGIRFIDTTNLRNAKFITKSKRRVKK